MGNHQSNQDGQKSNQVSALRRFSPLMIGIILCVLSFLFDEPVIEWVKAHDLKVLKHFAGFLSFWGDWPKLMVFSSVGLAVAWLARSRAVGKVFLCMMIAGTISGALVSSVRVLTGRARPNNVESIQEWNGLWRGHQFLMYKNSYHSFPSGHTGTAFAFFGVVFFANRRWGVWALLAAAAIAWSRIYLNVHHLSDIMAGAVIGLLIAALVWDRLGPSIERYLVFFFAPRK
jgi:membrane-associated phospholipid phosphatase